MGTASGTVGGRDADLRMQVRLLLRRPQTLPAILRPSEGKNRLEVIKWKVMPHFPRRAPGKPTPVLSPSPKRPRTQTLAEAGPSKMHLPKMPLPKAMLE